MQPNNLPNVYKGVEIIWDEDYDKRILTFIDELPEGERIYLARCEENEGSINLWWKNEIPERFKSMDFVHVEGDSWNIEKNIVLVSPQKLIDDISNEVQSLNDQDKNEVLSFIRMKQNQRKNI